MSFGWLGTFRAGSWREFRKFVLEERRDAAKRISVIQAELERIGQVQVHYVMEKDSEGNWHASEQRRGLYVTAGSSLERLLQAYIVMGGNPLDISLFLIPDSMFMDEATGVEYHTQPHGGVVAPQSVDVSPGGGIYAGGFLTLLKYVPARVGGRKQLMDSRVGITVAQIRKTANHAIRFKRNDLEARIIKLCDLREQLEKEAQEIIAALGGTITGIPDFDFQGMDPNLRVAKLIADIDSVFFELDANGVPQFDKPNQNGLAHYPSLLDDILPDEENVAL